MQNVLSVILIFWLCAGGFARPGSVYAMSSGIGQLQCAPPFISQIEVIHYDEAMIAWTDFSPDTSKRYALEIIEAGSQATGIATHGPYATLFTTISGLEQGTQYDVYIRSVCQGDETSPWNGPARFTTHILNSAGCGLDLPIPDQSCPSGQVFYIEVEEYPGQFLGPDGFLSGVDLIAEHPWVADLSLWLEAPDGTGIVLGRDVGVGVQDLGDPKDTLCTAALTFTDQACIPFAEATAPFVGHFLPEEPLSSFGQGMLINGLWKLIVCDKAEDDIGTLKHVALHFESNTCLIPPQVLSVRINSQTAELGVDPIGHCDSLEIRYGRDIISPSDPAASTVYAACTGNVLLENLDVDTDYIVYIRKKCLDSSAWSCPLSIKTACAEVTERTDFDSLAVCNFECGSPCPIDGNWDNLTDDGFDWIIHTGPTETAFTGPGQDASGLGNYLYIESSGEGCQNVHTAILESRCMLIDTVASGCHLSFFAHMAGPDIGTLELAVSIDAGASWTALYTRTGDQGPGWQQYFVDLSAFHGQLARFRFSASGATGAFGDIALDQIEFYGSAPTGDCGITYFVDQDRDGYGLEDSLVCLCASLPPDGFSDQAGDCDDLDASISPDADEVPCNLVDENCNGMEDDAIQTNPITYEIADLRDVSCTNKNDGMISLSVSGGQPPYLFRWNTGQDSNVVKDLGEGVYHCTIEDFNGCRSITEFIEIDVIEHLSFFLTGIDMPSCPGVANGAITGMITGGYPPYSYFWNTGDTTLNLDSLTNGVYDLVVSDTEGCFVRSGPIDVEAPASFQTGIQFQKQISCPGASDGILTTGVIGGVPPFSYQWNTGDTTSQITNLSRGFYTCTVTGSDGCQSVLDTVELTEPDPIEVHFDALDEPRCFGESSGTIQISVHGGTLPYFYTWSNGRFSDDLFNIAAGNYHLTITDGASCVKVLQDIVLEQPAELSIQIDDIQAVDCPGDANGSVTASVTGGTSPYQYFWNTGVQDVETLSGLQTGSYALTVSDARGCKESAKDIDIDAINLPLEIHVDSIGHIACHGDSTGLLIVSVEGENHPFRFNWSAGIQTISMGSDTLLNLPADLYRVTITDGAGCVGTSPELLINQASPLEYRLDQILHNTCFGGSEGAIQLTISGGAPPYQYSWSSGQTVEDPAGLDAGSYMLTTTDTNMCSEMIGPFSILQPDSVRFSFTVQHAANGLSNGSVSVSISGGTPPYQYLWDENTGNQTDQFVDGLAAGWYALTVTDHAGCQYVDSVEVDLLNATINAVRHSAYHITPNPASGSCILETHNRRISDIRIMASSGVTQAIPFREIERGTYGLDISRLGPGLYFVIVDQQAIVRLVVVNQ